MVRLEEYVILALTAVTIYETVKSHELSFTGVNVAEGKDTNQEPGVRKNFVSSLAVDGNTDTNQSHGSCMHTIGRVNTTAFWSVNLGGRYILNGIRIYNRATLEYRLVNFKVIGRPGDMILHNDKTATPQLYLKEVIDIPIHSNKSFNNITIEVPPHTGYPDHGNTYLHVCEVQIYSGTNVAEGKDTNQEPGVSENRNSALAVDGNTDTNDKHGSCSHTIGQVNTTAFWSVNLKGRYILYGIRIYNRASLEYRLVNFKVIGRPGDMILHNDKTATPQLYLKEVIDIPIHSNKSFNNITIEVPPHTGYPDHGTTYLHVCEVQIYSGGNCNAPASIRNGKYSQSLKATYWASEYLEWYCYAGHRSGQNITRECLLNSSWAGDDPACSLITCPIPGTFTNGALKLDNGSDIRFGDIPSTLSVTVICDEGFESTISRITCSLEGKWDSTPLCSQIRCTSLGLLTGGYYMYNYTEMQGTEDIYSYGTAVRAVCNETLFRATEGLLVCGQDGSWTGSESFCVALCEVPKLQNGYFEGLVNTTISKYEDGQSIKPMCNERYQLDEHIEGVSDVSLTCQANHTWGGQIRSCTKVECSITLLLHEENFYELDKQLIYPVKYNETISATCKDGYEYMSEDRERICLANRAFSGEELVCTVVECSFESLLHEENFYELDNPLIQSVKYNETISATCKDGYEYMAGDRERKCMAKRTFSGEELVCTAVTCRIDSLRTEENFYELNDSLASSVEYNAMLFGNCKGGYEHKSGDTERTCLSNKTLSGEELVCSAIQQDGSVEKSSSVPAAAGGSAAGVVVLFAVGIVAVVMLRWRTKKPDESEPEPSVVYDSIQDTKVGYHNVIYQNCNETRVHEVENEPCYDNTTIHKMSETAIEVADLADAVLVSDSATERFTIEFQSFPEGMVMPHNKARENRSKNRYRNLYAYDDTRVVLNIWDENTETDYINACYIHGFKEPRAYIASQGPVTDNLSDFWRMVWQTRCGKIVMLTNLKEEGKMKCNQYWPKEGTKVYGSIKVTLEDTDTFSNFVIRTLRIEKTGEQQRTVLHFHFTSWPDKDVPFFCSSMVHFRQKVKTATSSCSGPIVVHCSTGIGRTGAFIAIDYLIDESQELGYVDVAMCVATLRRQRVNMVQTKKQYEFVHQALVETLVMKTSVVPASEFEEYYCDLLSIDPAKRKRKLDVEFEMLSRLSPKTDDKKKAETRDDQHIEKSRYSSIHQAKEHMPSLSQQGLQLFGEFINASFLPTYKESNALIITQSPLESTKEDFWKMVYHQNVHTIVMMNDVSELEVCEIYWPGEGMNIAHGDMIISNEGVENQRGHTILTLRLSKSGEGRQMQLVQFGGWKADTLLPKPVDILSGLYLVEDIQRRNGNHPVVVHCMDGVEKSGLFCVIVSLLDRTNIEQDVAISQVIEEMRGRRENIIPNVQQFEFLHEVMLAFLQQFETYSNFSL